MSEPSSLQRPRQVTLAAWMVIGGSVLLVGGVFEQISTLHRLETRESVSKLLSEPPFAGLGLELESAITIMRTMSMVAAGCAAATAILGFHVLKRNRAARLALTLVAVPLFLSGVVVGGFLSSLVAASAAMLWLAPSRDWFDGIAPRRPPDPDRQADAPPAWPPVPPSAPPPQEGPRPHQGFGSAQPPGSEAPPQSPQQSPQQFPPYAPPGPDAQPYDAPAPPYGTSWAPPAVGAGPRPTTLVVACITTWVFSSLAVLLMGATALVVATDPDLLIEEMRRQNSQLAEQGLDRDALVRITLVMAGVVVAWAAAAIVLAVLVFRRVPWARIALLASAGGAGGLCLVAAVQSVLFAVPLLACAVTFSLLLRPDVRAWFARS